MHRKRVEKSPPSPKQRSARGVDWAITLQFLLLSSITFGLYARGLVNGFVTDDEKEVLRDPLIRNLADIPRFFAHSVWYFAGVKVENYYRPLKLVAYAIEYQMFGFWAPGWHLAGISFHVTAVIMVYLVVRELSSSRLGLWTALWFALHPIHVEPVCAYRKLRSV